MQIKHEILLMRKKFSSFVDLKCLQELTQWQFADTKYKRSAARMCRHARNRVIRIGAEFGNQTKSMQQHLENVYMLVQFVRQRARRNYKINYKFLYVKDWPDPHK
jgi:hypothetical protein